MYQRMLNKEVVPSMKDMSDYCGDNSKLFSLLNDWLVTTYQTETKIVYPYGNKYGWCVGHYKKKKLVCNIFAEENAFTVMIRLTNDQFASIYQSVGKYTQDYIDHKYPCSDGGWIHYRVTCQNHYQDIIELIKVKCN